MLRQLLKIGMKASEIKGISNLQKVLTKDGKSCVTTFNRTLKDGTKETVQVVKDVATGSATKTTINRLNSNGYPVLTLERTYSPKQVCGMNYDGKDLFQIKYRDQIKGLVPDGSCREHLLSDVEVTHSIDFNKYVPVTDRSGMTRKGARQIGNRFMTPEYRRTYQAQSKTAYLNSDTKHINDYGNVFGYDSKYQVQNYVGGLNPRDAHCTFDREYAHPFQWGEKHPSSMEKGAKVLNPEGRLWYIPDNATAEDFSKAGFKISQWEKIV